MEKHSSYEHKSTPFQLSKYEALEMMHAGQRVIIKPAKVYPYPILNNEKVIYIYPQHSNGIMASKQAGKFNHPLIGLREST